MEARENVLIVDDEPVWRNIYERFAVARSPNVAVRVAADFAGAKQLIAETKFAVAFIDVGLDSTDDSNTDGLRVIQQIRTIGDETSIILITGRSGSDVLEIVRKAVRECQVFDILGKGDIAPSHIRRLLETGVMEYRRCVSEQWNAVKDALCGSACSMIWESQVWQALGFEAGCSGFYDFLAKLFDDYLPIIGGRYGADVDMHITPGLVYGSYWSRSITCAVGLCFGAVQTYEKSIRTPRLIRELFGVPNVGQPVRELAEHGIRGGVFRLEPLRREDFSSDGDTSVKSC